MKYLSTITIISCFYYSCQSDCMTPIEYMKYVQSSSYPGLVSFDDNSGFVVYKSTAFMVLNSTSTQSWSQSNFNSTRSKFDNLLYFELVPKRRDGEKRPAVLDEMSHYKREKGIEDNITLVINQDTFEPVLFQPERYYGLKEDRFILGFEKPDQKINGATLIYSEEGQLHKVEFSSEQLIEPRINW